MATDTTIPGNGTAGPFSITFPYLERTDIKVSVDEVVTTDFSFDNDTQIRFTVAPFPTSGQTIRIFRDTDISSPQATFVSGSAIRAQDLNNNNLQLVYSAQEREERSLDSTGGTLSGTLDMSSNKIINLGTPTAGTDAATKDYADLKVAKAGDTMTGLLTLSGNPTANNHAATKTYVDSADQLKLDLAGGTMTGPIAMGGSKVTGLGTPTDTGDAATKAYVDGVAVSGIADGDRGDITVSNSGGTWTIDNGTITSAKMDTNIELQGTFSSGNATFKGQSAPGQITLNCEANTHGITIKSAPHSAGATYTLQLPDSLPTQDGHALKSDLSGNLSWGTAGGASGGGTDQVFYEHDQTVTTNYSLGANKNAITAGPITINTGVTVTVPSTSNWVIV